MTRALAIIAALALSVPAGAAILVDGEEVEVIDTHLHPGHWGQQPLSGKTFLVGALPASLRLYAPALFDRLLDPYADHVGIVAQTTWAGVDQAILYATYTHHTSGYFTNAQLVGVLTDPANDGWAFGLASINLDDISDADVRAARLEELRGHLEAASGAIVGFKLAHAHQKVAFDDEVLVPLYDLAAEQGLPVLLHTGFSPFPNSSSDPTTYDPRWLRELAEAYDGTDGRPRVDFVLSHVGQGDARAVASALALAEELDNVWLEISALARPLLLDERGEMVTGGEPQYRWVLAEILDRGLVDKTIFASDGPQFSGMVRTYVNLMVGAMGELGYDVDQVRAVMAGNARRLYLQDR